MELWNGFVDWFFSEDGQLVVYGAIVPFLAVLVAGIVASLIGKAGIRRLVAQRDRETRASAVAALIAVGHTAARWHSQPPAAREHHEALASAADIQVRLLPLGGANLAADWAAHELAGMRVNSVSYSFQADQSLAEYRDRLVEWLHKPSRAKKLFSADLERWRYEDQSGVDPVVVEQQRWAEEQFTSQTGQSADAAHETPTAAMPAPADTPSSAPTASR
ncbi:hypothetical protein [Homoserinibacter sp. YIM 151385]|uniref:hypothetical protein n=1 Tax=Homoserinibacter sp. YIM 151385 TaxID=2985506 RepID=UPI0022F0BB70|nr:hypothetical protein [Homoserinibacter sp. YIM 151385]WBU39055.1 hypothetical protein OF852_05605 [Homoserinibacter sp. YIM 151385]